MAESDGRRRSSARVTMDEQLERLRDSGGGLSAMVRLVQCIVGPRLRRQYFAGTDGAVSRLGGYYLESRLCHTFRVIVSVCYDIPVVTSCVMRDLLHCVYSRVCRMSRISWSNTLKM